MVPKPLPIMRFTDHTRTALDETCPRARYWGFEYQGRGLSSEYQGRGLSSVEPNEDLAFGLEVAMRVDALRSARAAFALIGAPGDSAVLLHGLVEAYRTLIWPKWLAEYELIGTEVEVGIQLTPDLYYQARPDAVLRRKADQTVWVLSDKTTSLNAETFIRIWDKSAQNHVECLAVESTLGITVSGFFTQGWAKGYKKDNTIYSPLCYGWVKEGQPGLTKDRWSEKYVYGWERRRIDQFPDGVAAWVKQLPVGLVKAQFPVAGPIPLRRDLAQEYLEQVEAREQAIADGTDDERFPKRFQHCDEFGKFRRPCEFRDCCWSPMVGRDPIGSGLYEAREPHHEPERRCRN